MHLFRTMMIIIAAAILIQIVPTAPDAHEFYMSTFRIDIIQDSTLIRITAKIFTTDLEEIRTRQQLSRPPVGQSRDAASADSLMHRYFQRHFSMFSGKDSLSISYLSREVDGDVTLCYFQARYSGELKKLWLSNSVLIDIFEKQTNITHIFINNRQKSLIFRKGQIEQMVTL